MKRRLLAVLVFVLAAAPAMAQSVVQAPLPVVPSLLAIKFGTPTDTGLSRCAAGVVCVGNGTAGDYSGTIAATKLGIGTASPGESIEVKGDGKRMIFDSAAGTNAVLLGHTTSNGGFITLFDNSGGAKSRISAYDDSYIATNLRIGTNLIFGAADASHAMWSPSGTTVQARLGDDSGYAPLSTGGITVNGLVDNYNALLVKPTLTTTFAQITTQNAGGTFFFGVDNSLGVQTGTAYTSAIWNVSNRAMVFGTNNTARMTIAASGGVTFAGAVTMNAAQTVATTPNAAATLTLDATHYLVVNTAVSPTITLPTAVGITGRTYVIKNRAASGAIILATTSSQTIDGAAPGTVAVNASITLTSDGANWIIQ